jgi:quercetin 2,3-dioxygenase
MSEAAEVKIFPGEQRPRSEADWYRTFHTFNFGEHFHEHRKPFLQIYGLNEETLKQATGFENAVEFASYCFVLPLVGGVKAQVNDGAVFFVDSGEARLLSLKKGSRLKITNPYKTELVNFLTIWFHGENIKEKLNTGIKFDLDHPLNTLHSLVSQPGFRISLGKFAGRTKLQLALNPKSQGVFAFVIEGAFEFNNRLLQQRDGLAIASASKIDFEALSNHAMLLMIEM